MDYYLLAESAAMTNEFISLFWISLAALLAPLLSTRTGGRVPSVVLLLVFGVLLGPDVLNLANNDHGIGLISELGLGLLFLVAGMEMNTDTLRGKQGKQAFTTWLVCLAFAFGIGLLATNVFRDVEGWSIPTAIALAVALTSTAMGTLLPIVKQSGDGDTALGRAVMTHGAIGELGPVVAIALLLSSRSALISALVLVLFAVVTVLAAIVPGWMIGKIPGLRYALREGMGSTTQTSLRLVMTLLTALMAVAAVFELDIVLGAFAAGIVLRRMAPAFDSLIEVRLEVIAFGFFIPVFFVTAGMSININAVSNQLGLMAAAVLLIMLARGVPVWLREVFADTGSEISNHRDRIRLGLYASTGLPIIVAVTNVAVSGELMSPDIASVLVAAGAVTVLLFPAAARMLQSGDSQYVAGNTVDDDGYEPATTHDGKPVDESTVGRAQAKSGIGGGSTSYATGPSTSEVGKTGGADVDEGEVDTPEVTQEAIKAAEADAHHD